MRDADRRSQDRVTVSGDVGQNHRFRLPPEGQYLDAVLVVTPGVRRALVVGRAFEGQHPASDVHVMVLSPSGSAAV